MGRYVNSDNSAFQVALNTEIYVDKTELLTYTNRIIDTKNGLICNSRPRRFGKSTIADMLAAYYSKGCDSARMFEGLKIENDPSFRKHLNQYEVIHIDVQWCRNSAGSAGAVVTYIEENVIGELREIYPDIVQGEVCSLQDVLDRINNVTGQKFIIIIDEWDALIRDEAQNARVQEEYINLLRGLFKGTQPTKFLHLAYLTGILPIKKIQTQSALNNFDEFSMLDASVMAPYVGFTEEEVRGLCEKYQKDFDGLKSAIIAMISGESIEVSSFQNDMLTFEDKDDVLTLLVHLGYLAYNKSDRTAAIPNEEIRSEFVKATKRRKWNEL